MNILNCDKDPSAPIGVLGLGRSGISTARFLASNGYPVLACEEGTPAPEALELQGLPGIDLRLSHFQREEIAKCRSIVLSPGIPRYHPVLAQPLATQTPIVNDIEILYQWSQQYSTLAYGRKPRFIGITGTNGKSTVTTLVGLMMEAAGFITATGGNLGPPALSLWDPQVEVYVLELSSFQLESTLQFHPNTSALLNLTPDHLDRYPDLTSYLNAKKRIFIQQNREDYAILNADDSVTLGPVIQEMHASPVQVIPFSIQRSCVGGVYVREGIVIDHRNYTPVPLLEVANLKITGLHNLSNAVAAAAIALSEGVSGQTIAEVLQQFPGLAHRMEWIATKNDIRYYNDSKGTNVGAVVQSLRSFPDKVILIAGGRSKNSDFSSLASLIRQHVSGLVLMGEAADEMAMAFAGLTPIARATQMNEAVALATRMAHPGEAVLLSPACASLDMYRNFEERGERFREAVYGLS
ncbi:MAG: UDP-N-acetylmuramoyl-L-alanine--D-glutamate ligase [Magnetococcus sp. DMHC-6]